MLSDPAVDQHAVDIVAQVAPPALVPMKLPSTTFAGRARAGDSMPSQLKPMVLAPPIVLFGAVVDQNPSTALPRLAPLASVPMKLPSTTFAGGAGIGNVDAGGR